MAVDSSGPSRPRRSASTNLPIPQALRLMRLLVLALGASTVLAGEVKGPPNQIHSSNVAGALEHADSACAASGLNDFD